MESVEVFFYYLKNEESECLQLPGIEAVDVKLVLWQPGCSQLIPKDLPLLPFSIWTIFHYCHVFLNRDYGILLIYDGDTLAHRSCVFPQYFRFPFMSKNDLQIGDTWTHPAYRGKGFAVWAVREIVRLSRKPGRRFWYVTETSNASSIKVVEKAGFVKAGTGLRNAPLGLSILGAFRLLNTEMGKSEALTPK